VTVDVFAPQKYSSLLIYLLKYVINVNKVLQLLFYNNILIFDLVEDNRGIRFYFAFYVIVCLCIYILFYLFMSSQQPYLLFSTVSNRH